MATPLQASAAAASSRHVSMNWDLLGSITSASPVVQVTLFFLVVLSVLCWAVALSKYSQLRKMTELNESFLNDFWKAASLEDLSANIDEVAQRSGIARVFQAGFIELRKLADQGVTRSAKVTQLSGSDNLERSLRKAVNQEISAMEVRLNILATTGSTGPFIGLFGTVWGIMNSFHKIGLTGSASLAVVAPGISEALFTTAVGLLAAIPAVVLYNHFVSLIRHEEIELNNFATDFMNIAKRNFFRE